MELSAGPRGAVGEVLEHPRHLRGAGSCATGPLGDVPSGSSSWRPRQTPRGTFDSSLRLQGATAPSLGRAHTIPALTSGFSTPGLFLSARSSAAIT